MSYKWDTPHQWFDDYLARHKDDTTELFNLCSILSRELDSDQMQDLFQSDMDRDEYFEPKQEPEQEDSEPCET